MSTNHNHNNALSSDSPLLSLPSFPPLPGPRVDVSQIRGNVSDQSKRLAVNIFSHFIGAKEQSFGAEVGQRLRLVEMNVWVRNGKASQAQTVFEITVAKGKDHIHDIINLNVTDIDCRRHVQYLWDSSWCLCNVHRRPVSNLSHSSVHSDHVVPLPRCSVSALVVLGAAMGVDGTGVSQSMNLIWHQPAKMSVFFPYYPGS